MAVGPREPAGQTTTRPGEIAVGRGVNERVIIRPVAVMIGPVVVTREGVKTRPSSKGRQQALLLWARPCCPHDWRRHFPFH